MPDVLVEVAIVLVGFWLWLRRVNGPRTDKRRLLFLVRLFLFIATVGPIQLPLLCAVIAAGL